MGAEIGMLVVETIAKIRRAFFVQTVKDTRCAFLAVWRSTVDLLISHEGAYLEHCRKYALDNP
jgi:hypothetical protein